MVCILTWFSWWAINSGCLNTGKNCFVVFQNPASKQIWSSTTSKQICVSLLKLHRWRHASVYAAVMLQSLVHKVWTIQHHVRLNLSTADEFKPKQLVACQGKSSWKPEDYGHKKSDRCSSSWRWVLLTFGCQAKTRHHGYSHCKLRSCCQNAYDHSTTQT